MKKRRIAIAAFLLAATLVMGVGFAAITGTLNITGTAYFHGKSATSSDILAAIRFTDNISVNDESIVVANKKSDHAASMDVTFRDTDAVPGEVFTATATYEIEYTSDKVATLPDITFSVPAPTITSAAGSPGFAITTNWNAPQTISFGDTITVTVTVTYTNQDPAETGSVSATIAVPLPYVTVE